MCPYDIVLSFNKFSLIYYYLENLIFLILWANLMKGRKYKVHIDIKDIG